MKSSVAATTWKLVPWGLIATISLVATIERHAVRRNLGVLNIQALSWKYARGEAKSHSRRRDILCFGDSLVKFGILPRVLKQELGVTSRNLAAHASPAPATYFLLRKALANGARPSRILVDFSASLLAFGPNFRWKPYPWSELLTLTEGMELAWEARDPQLFAEIVAGLLSPSYRNRFQIRTSVQRDLAGHPARWNLGAAKMIWDWDGAGGAQLSARVGAVQTPPPGDPPSSRSTWRPDPINTLYVERFLQLASRRGIEVFWVLPPLHPANQAQSERLGDESLYLQFVRTMHDRFPEVVVIDARHAGFEGSAFIDLAHLDHDGAAAFTSVVADILRTRRRTEAAAPRWLALGKDRDRPPSTPEETGGPRMIADQSSSQGVRR